MIILSKLNEKQKEPSLFRGPHSKLNADTGVYSIYRDIQQHRLSVYPQKKGLAAQHSEHFEEVYFLKVNLGLRLRYF